MPKPEGSTPDERTLGESMPSQIESATTPDSAPGAAWHDGKRYLWLLGLVVPMFAFIAWGLVRLTGLGIFWYLGPMMLLIVIPLLDLVVGTDKSNPPEEVVSQLEQDRYYRWITFLFLPVQYAALIWACWVWTYSGLTWPDRIGLALTIGVIAGTAINTAHELGHKRDNLERWLAKIALAQSCYGHFYVEHNRGHHSRVATPDDPASSRVGESVWIFLPRTVCGGYRSAWKLEQPRFKRRGQSYWSIRNDAINAWLMSAILWVALLVIFGLGLLPFLLIQAVMGVALLEFVNYIEHYGMLRRREANGRWERVRPTHSWNSNNVVTNVLLYQLQRHSDHHANPTRRYQALRDFESAPALPTGYAGMIMLAAVPPLWYRVMDPRVAAHFDGDLSWAHIQASKRDKVLARYSLSAPAQARVAEAPDGPGAVA